MNKYKWFALLISVLVLLVSSAPFIYFSLTQKDDLVFLGRRYTNSQDTYTYISFIKQGMEGHNLFKNLYTSEDKTYTLFRPSYLLIAKYAQLTSQPAILAYHTSRIVFCILFFMALWKFLSHFSDKEKDQFIIYTLILVSSGLGAILVKWLPDSIDLWVPEGNTFFALGEAPHFILSQLLMVIGYGSFLTYLKKGHLSSIFFALLSFLFLSFEHPFNLVVIVPVLFFVLLWHKASWPKTVFIPLLASLGLIYQYYSTISNPILTAWQAQNILLSPIPLLILTGYGLLIPLALVGTETILGTAKTSYGRSLLITWVAINSLTLYLPVNFQRRLLEGFHLPLTILAGFGLLYLVKSVKTRLQNLVLTIAILLLSATSIFMIYMDFSFISRDSQYEYYYHIHKDELSAISWLEDHSSNQDIILSNWYLGNLIPGLTGRQVYFGHKVQTINSDLKSKNLDYFVQGVNSQTSDIFLKENHIKYIFLGRYDSLIQQGFKADNYQNLVRVYDQNGIQIYEVKSQ